MSTWFQTIWKLLVSTSIVTVTEKSSKNFITKENIIKRKIFFWEAAGTLPPLRSMELIKVLCILQYDLSMLNNSSTDFLSLRASYLVVWIRDTLVTIVTLCSISWKVSMTSEAASLISYWHSEHKWPWSNSESLTSSANFIQCVVFFMVNFFICRCSQKK